jgi:hypothetical protein
MHESAGACEKGLVAFYKLAKAELIANPADEGERVQFYQLEISQSVLPPTIRASRKSSAAEITHFRLQLRRSASSGLGRNDRGECNVESARQLEHPIVNVGFFTS